jgi:hypothetical protein
LKNIQNQKRIKKQSVRYGTNSTQSWKRAIFQKQAKRIEKYR